MRSAGPGGATCATEIAGTARGDWFSRGAYAGRGLRSDGDACAAAGLLAIVLGAARGVLSVRGDVTARRFCCD